MPISPTYPGVYIQELSSDTHTIAGVSTSIAAFVGEAKTGPINEPVRIRSFAQFERSFGGLDTHSEMSYAVYQFFLNGGTDSWVVRVVGAAKSASQILKNATSEEVATVTALDPGFDGNRITVIPEPVKGNPNIFNLEVTYKPEKGSSTTETFHNLSMNSNDPKYVESVVNGTSKYISVSRSDLTSLLKNQYGFCESATLARTDLDPLVKKNFEMSIIVNGLEPVKVSFETFTKTNSKATLDDVCSYIEKAVNNVAYGQTPLSKFKCTKEKGSQIIVMTSGEAGENSSVVVQPGAPHDAAAFLKLGAAHGGLENDAVAAVKPKAIIRSGDANSAAAYPYHLENGSSSPITSKNAPMAYSAGQSALDTVDFNLLCLPGVTNDTILDDALSYCRKRRAFLIADLPGGDTPDSALKAAENLRNSSAARGYGAVYFPWIKIGDPLTGKTRTSAPSGTIAGVYARTDGSRGVWKAPAGLEAVLSGAQGLAYKLTDAQNGDLNTQGVNCLRSFSSGRVCWGARTLSGYSDSPDQSYGYVSVRRLALYIESSLYEGTQWTVFEPNDESLWSSLRLSISSFMHELFRKGAFPGKTPKECYFVKCDSDTTTGDDINQGRVNVTIGFAPLKPAEFVVLSIEQMVGQ